MPIGAHYWSAVDKDAPETGLWCRIEVQKHGRGKIHARFAPEKKYWP
jgi:hypothetical protein